MKDNKLREFLGVVEDGGWVSAPYSINGKRLGLLAHLRARIESIEEYLKITYESSPSMRGYPKHIKLTEEVS